MTTPAFTSVGYVALLKGNKRYRDLWTANVISLLGDWLDLIAITELVVNLANMEGSRVTSTGALAGIMIARFLPSVVFGPLAGNVADQYPRHKVMMAANVVASVCVLLFLPFLTPEGIPIIIGLTFLKMVTQAFFLPANQAAVPMVVASEHLTEANALGATSWSVMLAVGAVAGAAIVAWLGPEMALIIDAVTFLIANYFLRGLEFPPAEERHIRGSGLEDYLMGLRYIRSNRHLAGPLLTKTILGASGGAILYPLMAEHTWPRTNPDGTLAISYVTGMLYFAFGLGTFIGPMIVRRFGQPTVQQMFARLFPSFMATGLFGVIFAYADTLNIAFIWLMVSSMARAMLWVYSTTLLQVLVPDRFRGRVFAVEFAIMTLAMTIAIGLQKQAIDSHLFDPRGLAEVLGWSAVIGGLPYVLLMRKEVPASA